MKLRDGITVDSKVDLWIGSKKRCVRATVTHVGHKFTSSSCVELVPTVKYFLDEERVSSRFPSYGAFNVAWKQAK